MLALISVEGDQRLASKLDFTYHVLFEFHNDSFILSLIDPAGM